MTHCLRTRFRCSHVATPLAIIITAATVACVDATRLIHPEPLSGLAIVRYGDAALEAAQNRAVAMANAGDSSFLWHLQAMKDLRSPQAPTLNEEPTGTEPPIFVKPTYTRATISPYNAGVLVETSYKYAYHLKLEGNWSITAPSGGGPAAPYSFSGNTGFDWSTGIHHHALDLEIPTLPSACGSAINAATTHTISRTDIMPTWGPITWSPAEKVESTWGEGNQNPCRPPRPCGTEVETSPESTAPGSGYECPASTTGNGSGGGSGGTITYVEITTCYYIDYYDGNGNFLRSELEYCTYEVYYY